VLQLRRGVYAGAESPTLSPRDSTAVAGAGLPNRASGLPVLGGLCAAWWAWCGNVLGLDGFGEPPGQNTEPLMMWLATPFTLAGVTLLVKGWCVGRVGGVPATGSSI
jgi:hypothetical protein